MAGIYIKGMEIPESCLDCKVHYVWGSGRPQCLINGEFIDDPNAYKQKRLEECPLIPVPDHGDLIDRETALDSLMNGMVMTGCQSRAMDCLNEIYVPTIISEDKEGEA